MDKFNWSPSQYQKIDQEIFIPVYYRQANKNLGDIRGIKYTAYDKSKIEISSKYSSQSKNSILSRLHSRLQKPSINNSNTSEDKDTSESSFKTKKKRFKSKEKLKLSPIKPKLIRQKFENEQPNLLLEKEKAIKEHKKQKENMLSDPPLKSEYSKFLIYLVFTSRKSTLFLKKTQFPIRLRL